MMASLYSSFSKEGGTKNLLFAFFKLVDKLDGHGTLRDRFITLLIFSIRSLSTPFAKKDRVAILNPEMGNKGTIQIIEHTLLILSVPQGWTQPQ